MNESSRLSFTKDPLALGATGVLFIAFVLGGASRANEFRLALVELAALPLLAAGLWRLLTTGGFLTHKFALSLAGLAVLIPLLQLVPLPPEIWRSLPGREEVVLAAQLTGLEASWLPASLTPSQTWASALALIPPIAVLFASLGVSRGAQRALVAAVLIAAVANILLGVGQIASGRDWLYPYEGAEGSMVGFFANRNHLATLLLVALPLTGAFIGSALHQAAIADHRVQIALATLFVMMVLVALGIVRSRVGVLIGGPALLAAGAIAWRASSSIGKRGALIAISIVGIASIGAVIAFASSPLLARFEQDVSTDDRFGYWSDVVAGAERFLPLGSGVGSFDPVYRSIEPADALQAKYLNHAHNDYLELLLETGWVAAVGLVGFGIWFGRRIIGVIRGDPTRRGLAFATIAAISLILIHSTVDYPLRTESILCVFALCCAILEKSGRGGGTAHAKYFMPSRNSKARDGSPVLG